MHERVNCLYQSLKISYGSESFLDVESLAHFDKNAYFWVSNFETRVLQSPLV